jgi:hypothetical protein
MCMFTKSVSLVANTSIFARSCAAGRQVLVYSMTMDADADLAMILPLPVEPGIGEPDVRFIDLSSYTEFFDDLAKAVTIGHSNCRSPTRPERTSREPTLLVRDVGSLEASFAPTRADLDRLDPRFRLQPKVWRKLPGYKDFGFAVFKLRPGLKHIHPMALEFPSRDPESLFFPTVHVHDGGTVPPSADFDHKLYFQSAKPVWMMEWFASGAPAGTFMRQAALPPDLMDLEQECCVLEIHGPHPNRDVYLVEDQHGRVTEAS